MLIACNRGLGSIFGFPDLCYVPSPAGPIPTPLPNEGMNAMAMPFSLTTRICMMAALTIASKYLMTMLDSAGIAGPMMLAGSFTMGNPIVSIDNIPAVNLTSLATGNDMNCPLSAVLIPSLANVFFCYRDDRGAGAGSPLYEDVAALADRMASDPIRGELLPNGVGHVAIAHVTSDLPRRIHNEIRRLAPLGMTSLVLDLRGNPGGDAEGALRTAEDFLAEGAVLARRVEEDGDETVLSARTRGDLETPLVVLVDGRTASAAELLAGSLQANGRAIVVGERTYGKGIAQRIAPATGAHGMVLAPAGRYLLPSGAEIEGAGILPDVVVSAAEAAARRSAAAEHTVADPS